MYSFISDFFLLSIMLVRFISIVHILVVCSFSFLCSIPLYDYTKICLSFLLFMDIWASSLALLWECYEYSHLETMCFLVNICMHFYNALELLGHKAVFSFSRYCQKDEPRHVFLKRTTVTSVNWQLGIQPVQHMKETKPSQDKEKERTSRGTHEEAAGRDQQQQKDQHFTTSSARSSDCENCRPQTRLKTAPPTSSPKIYIWAPALKGFWISEVLQTYKEGPGVRSWPGWAPGHPAPSDNIGSPNPVPPMASAKCECEAQKLTQHFWISLSSSQRNRN